MSSLTCLCANSLWEIFSFVLFFPCSISCGARAQLGGGEGVEASVPGTRGARRQKAPGGVTAVVQLKSCHRDEGLKHVAWALSRGRS